VEREAIEDLRGPVGFCLATGFPVQRIGRPEDNWQEVRSVHSTLKIGKLFYMGKGLT
jgi:hypothetical protein